MHTATIELARRVVASSWPALNDAVGDEAVRSVINWLGSALVGTREACGELDFAQTPAGIDATALAVGEGFDALEVAAMTASGTAALCYVDTHVPSLLSPSAAVGAALLPLAEHLAASGATFVHAYLLGIETACRAAMSMPSEGAAATATLPCNALGVAAACARMAGLDEDRTARALSAAWQHGAWPVESAGSVATAAGIGLRAVLEAHAEWGSPSAVASDAQTPRPPNIPANLVQDWGSQWQFTRLAYHAYPCALFLHPVAEACLQLKRTHHLTQRQIASVEVRMAGSCIERNRGSEAGDAMRARYAIEHVAAVALLDGTVGLAQFEPPRLRSPRVRELREKVRIAGDEQLLDTAAQVSVTLAGGETIDRHVRCALGHPLRPLSDADLSEKFRKQAADVLATDQAERLLGLAWNLRALPDVGGLIRTSIPDEIYEPTELPGSPLIPR